MKKKQDAIQAEYEEYKQMAQAEMQVNQVVIERQRQMHEKLFAELKATKILIEVPALREQLPKTNQQGMDFNKLTKQLGDIYKNTVSNLYDKSGLPDVTNTDKLVATGGKKGKSIKLKSQSVSVTPLKRNQNLSTKDRQATQDVRITDASSQITSPRYLRGLKNQHGQSLTTGIESEILQIQKPNHHEHPLVMYTSMQQIHQTSLRQFNKTKNTESAEPIILHQDKEAAQKFEKNHRSAYLNSITDESENAAVTVMIDETPERSVVNLGVAKDLALPFQNMTINEHSLGSKDSTQMHNMLIKEKS